MDSYLIPILTAGLGVIAGLGLAWANRRSDAEYRSTHVDRVARLENKVDGDQERRLKALEESAATHNGPVLEKQIEIMSAQMNRVEGKLDVFTGEFAALKAHQGDQDRYIGSVSRKADAAAEQLRKELTGTAEQLRHEATDRAAQLRKEMTA